MPVKSAKPVETSPSPNRLWAEQLAYGTALLLTVLIFLALFHNAILADGLKVLGPDDLDAYGWASLIGIFLQIVIHEAGTLGLAWWMRLPLKFRFFGFGANATAILEPLPRKVWRDALIGLAGPVTGTVVSLGLHGLYEITKAQDTSMDLGSPFLLGMACVGYFYNLFTLIPILDLEGGWIATAIAPPAWLLVLIASGLRLVSGFNILLLCVVCFALPRFVHLLRARTPRTDLPLTNPQRISVAVIYIVLVVGLAWVGSKTFEVLPTLVRASKGD